MRNELTERNNLKKLELKDGILVIPYKSGYFNIPCQSC